MSNKQDSPQWGWEADRSAAVGKYVSQIPSDRMTDRLIVESKDVPRNERIEELPGSLLQIPPFLSKTATKLQLVEFQSILHDLKEVHRDFHGEFTTDIEKYLAITNQHRPLTDRLNDWCEQYFSKRMERPNSKDKGNSVLRFRRLLTEYRNIFSKLETQHHSINYLYMQECNPYVKWLLWQWTDTSTFVRPQIETLPIRVLSESTFPSSPVDRYMYEYGLWEDNLLLGLYGINHAVDKDVIANLQKEDDNSIATSIEGLALDIQEMRPLLVRNFNPEKTIITIDGQGGCALGWEWASRYGIANLIVGRSHEDVQYQISTRNFDWPITVRHDGIVCDGRTPWIHALNDTRLPQCNPLALNRLVLELCFERLFSFYEQIDVNRYGKVFQRGVENKASTNAEDDDVRVAITCREIAKQESEDERASDNKPKVSYKRRFPQMRMQSFVRNLKRLGCEIKHGKGSEITAFRESGKKAIVSGHGKNVEVSSLKVTQVLKRLGVTAEEWVSLT